MTCVYRLRGLCFPSEGRWDLRVGMFCCRGPRALSLGAGGWVGACACRLPGPAGRHTIASL